MSALPADVLARARAVRVLALDVDGVLTDGRLHYSDSGHEIKTFHSRDGHGIKLAQRGGLIVAVISGRRSPALERRLAELGIVHAWLGCDDKGAALVELMDTLSVKPEEIAYMGDDWVDLPVFCRVGLAITVADGDAFVRSQVHWTTEEAGGAGAVRRVCETLLEAQGRLDELRAAAFDKS